MPYQVARAWGSNRLAADEIEAADVRTAQAQQLGLKTRKKAASSRCEARANAVNSERSWGLTAPL
jgi:hypothetical protein